MSDYSIPRFRKVPTRLLAIAILAGFSVIIGGLIFTFSETMKIREVSKQMSEMQLKASELDSLSKDLLITDNISQTFTAWRNLRTALDKQILAFLGSRYFQSRFNDADGKQQERYTRKLLELIKPEFDSIQFTIQRIINSNSNFSSGLYEIRSNSAESIPRNDINQVRDFSLYVGDLISVRLDNLSSHFETQSRLIIYRTFILLWLTSVVIMIIILIVLRKLTAAQLLNEETTNYLESILTAIYDISGQGFITYAPNLKVDTSISRQSARLIGTDPGNRDVSELLWHKPEDQEDFRRGMQLVFSGKARPEVVFDLFEKEITIQDRFLRVNFRYLSPKRIMLALTDISREHALQEMVKNEEHRRNLILKTIGNRSDFALFLHDAHALFHTVDQMQKEVITDQDLDSLVRSVHSLKGNAGFFGFSFTAEAAHNFEDHISDSRILGGDLNLAENCAKLQKAFDSELRHITDFLGESWIHDIDAITVPKDKFMEIEKYIKQNYAQDKKLINYYRSFRSIPFRALFLRYPDMIANLAEKLGKLIHPVTIEGGEFNILPETFGDFSSAFVHVIRNIVDHGIEPPAEREIAGKDRYGTVTIRILREADGIRIFAGDDGRGIQKDILEQKARKAGLLAEGESADMNTLLGFLVKPGLSTASEVTMISGRGVGLPAVNDVIEKLGGSLTIRTESGRSTDFDIFIPLRKGKK